MKRLALLSCSPEETVEMGSTLGTLLVPGIFIALHGGLGTGKTCFTRGIVAGAAPESAHLVASPTYAIMNEYPGATPVYHFDFYRLSSTHEIAELGFEDYFMDDGICVAEWSERLEELLPPDYMSVILEHNGENRRILTFEVSGPAPEAILTRFAQSVKPEKIL